MKVLRIEEALKKHPGLRLDWKELPYGGLENPRFGKVERIVVADDEGNPLWDQYQIDEKIGAIIVPYLETQDLYVGLIHQVRPVIRDPRTGEQGKYVSIEVPRGFRLKEELPEDSAVRELGAETGKVVKKLEYIGRTNPNTAFYCYLGIPTFAAEVDPYKKSRFRPDATEKILRSKFYKINEVKEMIKENKIVCGLSKAALLEFFVYKGLI